MQLTVHSDYAVRVLLYLALAEGRLCSIAEIAKAYGVSKNHLVKVVGSLAQAGLLETVRGRAGGLRLGRAPSAIKVGAIYRATEPGFALAACFEDERSCRIVGRCGLKRVLDEALRAFLGALDQYTLEDLVQKPAPLAQLLRIGGSAPRARLGGRVRVVVERAAKRAGAKPTAARGRR